MRIPRLSLMQSCPPLSPSRLTFGSPSRPQHSLAAIAPTTAYDIWRIHNPCPDTSSPSEPWLSAFLLVAFHLNKGPVVEHCVPHTALSPLQQEFICNHAMPDSASVSTTHQDAIYSFRVTVPSHATHTTSVAPLLLAHTLFRQTPDTSNARGFFQKALVLVTSAPYITLPCALLSILSSHAFENAPKPLFQAVHDVSTWPDPRVQNHTRLLHLPFLTETITISLPHSFLHSFAAPTVTLQPQQSNNLHHHNASPTAISFPSFPPDTPDIFRRNSRMSSKTPIPTKPPHLVHAWPLCIPSSNPTIVPFHEIDIARALQRLHDKICTLWELLALGQPILIYALTPSQCSAAVLTLLGLVHPLPFVGDWRPYFCIQDPQYSQLAKASDISHVLPHGGVYGVTNLHMLHTLSFKHLLILPGADAAGKKKFRPGLQTSHRTSLRTSKQLLHMLNVAISSRAKGVPDVDRMVHEARACIFEKITRPFLRAFDRYLVPTWACGRSVTEEPYASDPFGRTLSLVELNFDTFPTPQDLASPGVIAVFKSTAISKHRMRNFYERFVAGPVFKAWWGEAREAAERECKVLHRTDVIEACVRGTGMGREMNVEGMNVRKTQECVADLMCRVQEEITKAVAGDYMLLTKLDALMESLVEVDTEDARRFAREKCLQREQMLSSAG